MFGVFSANFSGVILQFLHILFLTKKISHRIRANLVKIKKSADMQKNSWNQSGDSFFGQKQTSSDKNGHDYLVQHVLCSDQQS